MTLDRRSFLKLVGAGAGAAGLPMIGRAAELMPKGAKRVVVIGGGYGGTIAAKYIRMMDKSIEVVMIERNDHFVSCPFSNLYIGGILKDLNPLTIKYDKLAANHGVKVVQAEVTAIDPAAKVVTTSKGTVSYDRLVVSPGIDFRLEEMKGYNAAANGNHAACMEGRPADRAAAQATGSDEGRRHHGDDRPARSLPLPTRTLRARQHGGPLPEEEQA